MATHSSVLAWRIPGTGEPGGLPSMGSHRVRHDWHDLAAAAACCNKIAEKGATSPARVIELFSDAHRYFLIGTWLYGLPRWLMIKSLPAKQETQARFPGCEDSPGGRNGNPLQNSCQDNPVDKEAWWATVYGVTKSQTWLHAHVRVRTHTHTHTHTHSYIN